MTAQQKKMPSLRFPEYQEEWVEIKLGDILQKYRLGGNYVNSEYSSAHPLIKMGNIGRGNISLKKVEYIKQGESIDKNDKIHFGDLFFNTRNTLDLVGKVAVWKNELPVAYYNSNLMYLKFENNFFMNYKLNSYEGIKGLRRLATGTTSVAAIYTKDLLQLKLYISTNAEEQQKIADFLTAVDERILQLIKKKELLEQYKKGVMQQIFSQQIRFKGEKGNDYPEWEEKSLGEVTSFIRNGLTAQQNLEKVGFKVTRIETISNKKIDLNKVGFVKTEIDISNYKLEVGDLLFSNINSVSHIGKIAYVDKDYDLYHGMNLLNIRIDKSYSPLFYYYVLTTDTLKKHFETICNQAVSQASINQNDLKQTIVFVPALPEQKKIAHFLNCIDNKINSVNTEIQQTQLFKKALLQQMFC